MIYFRYPLAFAALVAAVVLKPYSTDNTTTLEYNTKHNGTSSHASLHDELSRAEFVMAPFSFGHRLAVLQRPKRNAGIVEVATGDPLSVSWSSSTGVRIEDDDVLALHCSFDAGMGTSASSVAERYGGRGERGQIHDSVVVSATSIGDARRQESHPSGALDRRATSNNVWTIDSFPEMIQSDDDDDSVTRDTWCEFRLYTRGSSSAPEVVVVVVAADNAAVVDTHDDDHDTRSDDGGEAGAGAIRPRFVQVASAGPIRVGSSSQRSM